MNKGRQGKTREWRLGARGSRLIGSFLGISVTCAISLNSADVRAWTNGSGICPFGSSDAYWPAGAHVMRYCSNKTYPGLPNSTLPANERTFTQVLAAWARAHWMWYRWYGVSAYIWLDQDPGHSCPSGNWWDTGNERNEIWFRDRGSGGSWATEYTDHATCFTWGNNRILASDISINHAKVWQIVEQNSIGRCLQDATSVEDTTMHELGHSYGLKHDESRIALMNTQKPRAKNCDVASGYHGYPMPDDYQGYLQHHKNYSGTRFNVAGTPWYKENGTGHADQVTHVLTSSAPSRTFTIKATLHSFFNHAWTGGQIAIGLRAIPVGTTPTFNASTKTWSKPGVLLPPWWIFTVNSWGSVKLTDTITVNRSQLPTDGDYRLWLHMDQDNNMSEVEEQDNLIPTGYIIRRSP